MGTREYVCKYIHGCGPNLQVQNINGILHPQNGQSVEWMLPRSRAVAGDLKDHPRDVPGLQAVPY